MTLNTIPNTSGGSPVRQSARWSNAAFILAAILLVLTIPLTKIASEFDNALGNVVIAVGVLSALMFAYFGAVFRKAWSPKSRLAIAILPPFFVGLAITMFRFDGMSGELVPQLRPRWSPKQTSISTSMETSIPNAGSQGSASLPNAPSSDGPYYEYESNQFFGNTRDGQHPNVKLDTDWEKNPPKLLWKVPIGPGWASFAVRDGLAITLEQNANGTQEHLLALNLETGKPIWKVTLDGSHYKIEGGAGPRTTPLIAGDLVYALTSAGKFVAASLKTGSVQWQVDLLSETKSTQMDFENEVKWGRSGSPLLVKDMIVVPAGGVAASGRNTLLALNKDNGEVIWRSGKNQINYSSPTLMTIDGVEQVVNIDEKTAAGYSLEDGTQLWQYDWPSNSDADASASQPILIDSTSLFISKGYLQGCALIHVRKEGDTWTATKKWDSNKSLKTKFTSCLVRDGYAYGLSDGKLECVDVKTGDRQWMKGRYGHGQVLMCNDLLLISSEDGELVVVTADPKGPKELSKLSVLDGVTWNIPTIAGDLVLIRNSAEAACLQLPTANQ